MSKFANLFRIAYHGGDFHGSQVQPDVVTVEGVVKNILKNLGASSPLFASRTDKGVNATCNIITTTSNKKCKEYVGDFIERLEEYPIWITGFSDVEIDFNPRIAIEREYRYYVFNEKNKVLFNEAMQLFVGKHDFKNFARILDTDIVDTRRTVKRIDVTSKGEVIMCEIRGLSFLTFSISILSYFMLLKVRNSAFAIVKSTLWPFSPFLMSVRFFLPFVTSEAAPIIFLT